MRRLQQEINMSVSLMQNQVREEDYVDLSNLDFDKLRAAFEKSSNKNAVVFDLQQAIEKKLQQMIQQNPIRMEFHDKYKKIIDEYNAGKDIQTVQQAFDDLNELMAEGLAPEMERAMREGLDEETEVKKVAEKTLQTLKAEKLKIARWRQSIEVSSQVKVMIADSLQWLPQEPYPGEELGEKSQLVYQHVYTNYQGARYSSYGYFGDR